jgi:hypothetical protein
VVAGAAAVIRSVLVVSADPPLRQRVGWLLDDRELAHVARSPWRRAVATRDPRPTLAIVDRDDVGKNAAGLGALLRAGWGESVPFVGLSQRTDVAAIAAKPGAAAGLRKPIDGGLLLTTVTWLAASTPASVDRNDGPGIVPGRSQPGRGGRGQRRRDHRLRRVRWSRRNTDTARAPCAGRGLGDGGEDLGQRKSGRREGWIADGRRRTGNVSPK